LQLEILADENVDFRIIQELRKNNIKVFSVFEEARGLSDTGVLELAKSKDSLILTEDKDFGEWIFSHHISSNGVIFLRYQFSELEEIIKSLMKLLEKPEISVYNKFVVLTKNKIRIRDL